jgi:hypothetical protein
LSQLPKEKIFDSIAYAGRIAKENEWHKGVKVILDP